MMEFADLSKVMDIVDKNMMVRVDSWLSSRKDGHGKFHINSKALDSFGYSPIDISTAYIIWALSEIGYFNLTNELTAMIDVANNSDDPYLVSLVACSCFNYNLTADYDAFAAYLVTK